MEKNKFGMTFKNLLIQTLGFVVVMYVFGYFRSEGDPNSLKSLSGILVGSLVFLAFMCWMYELNPFKSKNQIENSDE
ncbi:hypothetical protein [Belliella aquatica]|uniref:Uncharacterized protein n=1 Tax=Belliella aquatica TaxID=1323734 RepID=A0ABQ1ML38_9BACT|nr:hypothetical protein [Belliella aquatica]MCH7405386.1 hypothetical protein [Belliella aquatica]GGC42078.1 hypothetical protein GCM10010993_20800 [Belliella aquatica]